jgi:hypothetical protein
MESHWFGQCDSKRLDRSRSRILSKWLDDPQEEDVMPELYQSLSLSKWDC